jgi:hypothetical protein
MNTREYPGEFTEETSAPGIAQMDSIVLHPKVSR